MDFTFRPIVAWPGAMTKTRRRSQFKASYTDTLGLLDRELNILKARDIVLQIALAERDIRLDGRPRSDARPTHPGVILSFESKHGAAQLPV